jgi:hypothetical protein
MVLHAEQPCSESDVQLANRIAFRPRPLCFSRHSLSADIALFCTTILTLLLLLLITDEGCAAPSTSLGPT